MKSITNKLLIDFKDYIFKAGMIIIGALVVTAIIANAFAALLDLF